MEIGEVRYLLLYEYVEGMLERREPHRAAHLERIEAEREAGRILLSGPYDPPSGAMIGFGDVSRDQVEAFATADPYFEAGLITSWRVEAWKGR